MRIGIITGMAEEAAAFLPEEEGAKGAVISGFESRTVRCCAHDITLIHAGIGKVNAAAAAMMLALTHNVELLMIIGTAGKISGKAGNCFLITEAVQGDYGASLADDFVHFNAGAVPIGPSVVTPFRAAAMPDIGLPHARIVTCDAFIASGEHSARLRGRLGGDLVDMETAALAQVAQQLGLPWAAIKATTDDANGSSSGDFRANLMRAADSAADAAMQTIGLLPADPM
jgi:nucleoside phosphorylase